MKRNTLIIFDCFGVVTSEIAPVWFATRFPPEEAARIKDQYFHGADRGTKTIGALLDEMSEGLSLPKETIISEWKAIFSINTELLEIIKELSAEYHIALLSNAPRGIVEAIFVTYELYPLFDKVFISSHYCMAKPDREFYEVCVNSFAAMEKIYMIDDNISNLIDLETLGIKPHLFTSNEELLLYLREEKLLP